MITITYLISTYTCIQSFKILCNNKHFIFMSQSAADSVYFTIQPSRVDECWALLLAIKTADGGLKRVQDSCDITRDFRPPFTDKCWWTVNTWYLLWRSCFHLHGFFYLIRYSPYSLIYPPEPIHLMDVDGHSLLYICQHSFKRGC